MQPFQRAHLENNLAKLIRTTRVDMELLGKLQRPGLITEYNGMLIMNSYGLDERAFRLYWIMIKGGEQTVAEKGYEILKAALKETKQFKALQIVSDIKYPKDVNLVDGDPRKRPRLESDQKPEVKQEPAPDPISKIAENTLGKLPQEIDNKIFEIKKLIQKDRSLLNQVFEKGCSLVDPGILECVLKYRPKLRSDASLMSIFLLPAGSGYRFPIPYNYGALIKVAIDCGYGPRISKIRDSFGANLLLHWIGQLEFEPEESLVKLLVDNGIDINGRDNFQDGALHYAAKVGRAPEFIEMLVRLGADPHMTNWASDTALHTAVITQRPELIKCLLKIGINVDAKDTNGDSALMLAMQSQPTTEKSFRIVETLVEMGANVYSKNRWNASPSKYIYHRYTSRFQSNPYGVKMFNLMMGKVSIDKMENKPNSDTFLQ